MTLKSDPKLNLLLGALPTKVLASLLPHLKLVELPLGKVIYEPGMELKHVHFPLPGSIISFLCVTADGFSTEIAVSGNEGMVGMPLCMGCDSSTSQAVVISAGQAYQLNGVILKKEIEKHTELLNIFLLYTQTLINQTSHTAACNRHHAVDQQLCRWLLLSHDRVPSNELIMTQELIANMLGVRREGVTEAASKLQALGLIHYSRGHIEVIDRAGLEARVCECYAVIKNEYYRLLPQRIKPVLIGSYL